MALAELERWLHDRSADPVALTRRVAQAMQQKLSQLSTASDRCDDILKYIPDLFLIRYDIKDIFPNVSNYWMLEQKVCCFKIWKLNFSQVK